MKKSFHGESSPGISNTLHSLGSGYQERGNLQKAEEYFLKFLEMEKSFQAESSPCAAVTLHQLRSVYYERMFIANINYLQEAEKLILQSLEMYRLFYVVGEYFCKVV